MENKERKELAEWVIKKTLENGAAQASVGISNGRSVDVSYRDKKIEKLQESTENSLVVSIYVNNRYSSHDTSDLRKEALEKFIGQAVASTKYLTEDEYRTLPDAKLYPDKFDIDLELVDDSVKSVDSSTKVNIASEIEEAAKTVSDQIISVTSGYSDGVYSRIFMNSNGFSGESKGTYFSAGAEVTVKDKEDGRPSDWYWATTRFFNELPSREMLGKEAARRALRKIGQKKIASGKYLMLVENRTAGSLLSTFQRAMTARSIQQKSSFLDGMLDKKIASDKLTVIDDPFVKKGLASRIYDGEGIAAKKRVMIEKGVLKNYYVDNYYGKKTGMAINSGSSSNLIFEYGAKSLEQMIKELKKGILVTDFIGGNSNPTTGDFSFGIVGLLVENGAIVQPVNEMNISGNAKDFWNTLIEVGSDPAPYSSVQVPSMLFDEVSFSGL
jgi:PmbA protein